MNAEVIAIGSELTSGQRLDTNSQWLSARLAEVGIPVRLHTTVADDLAANLLVLRQAVERSDLVLITGGLGPTQDDLTREAMAQVAGVELVFHPPSMAAIEQRFARRGRPLPERNRVQAMVPAGSEPIPNDQGTAPGIWMTVARAAAGRSVILAAMPGVPSEMVAMFEAHVLPRLQALAGSPRQVIVHRVLNLFGAGESDVEARVMDLTRRGREPEVGITVSDATISLRITARGGSPEAARAAIEPIARIIYDRLGDLIFGEGADELQTAVARLLVRRGRTLATAESCTGGLVGQRLTEVPGISSHYLGGVVAYSNAAKQDFLGVPADLIDRIGAVSPEVAERMAGGCRQRFGADLAVAVTGVAGPGGGSADKPVGTVYLALAGPHVLDVRRLDLGNQPRGVIQSRSAKHALNLVRLHLLEHAGGPS